jgi:hypothetical protein
VIKNLVYKLIILFDKFFIFFQYFYYLSFSNYQQNFFIFNTGWGGLVQTIYYLEFIFKNKKKNIFILDYDKLNQSVEFFTKNFKIKKIYSIFSLIGRDFSQYPKKFELQIKLFCNKLFDKKFSNTESLIIDKKNNYLNSKIVSKYIAKRIKTKLIFSHSLKSLNDQINNKSKKNFFQPNKNTQKLIERVFNCKIGKLKNAINICIRKRNKIKRNDDRTNYLRDGNVANFIHIIKYLIKNYDYKIFITGDVNSINLKHKNLYYYKEFQDKISKDLYQLSIQSLTKYHIMNSGGSNQIMKFNNGKFLYIDCWPPVSFTPDSVILFKNIFKKKKKMSIFSYIRMYEKDCLKYTNEQNLKLSNMIFFKYFYAKNYIISSNKKEQVLQSLKEFLIFISNKKKLNFKNKSYTKISKFYQKILIDNKCLLSSGNS